MEMDSLPFQKWLQELFTSILLITLSIILIALCMPHFWHHIILYSTDVSYAKEPQANTTVISESKQLRFGNCLYN